MAARRRHRGHAAAVITEDLSGKAKTAGAGPYLILFLACLPALDMESQAGARQVLAAIRDTGASHAERRRLTAIILNRASDAARQTLEAMMSTAEWKDDFIESYVNVGLEQASDGSSQILFPAHVANEKDSISAELTPAEVIRARDMIARCVKSHYKMCG